MFLSVEDALRKAYRLEAQFPVKISSAFSLSLGSPLTPGELTPLDWVAQSALILATVNRTLQGRELCAVRGSFTVPVEPSLVRRRNDDAIHLGVCLRREIESPLDGWWFVDVAREWMGGRGYRHHGDGWWAKHLGKHVNTIRRLKRGSGDRPGLWGHLGWWLESGIQRLDVPMRDSGIVSLDEMVGCVTVGDKGGTSSKRK